MKQIVVLISAVLLIMACNPAKRMARQQKRYQQMVDAYIKEHPPRIDTGTTFKKGIDSASFYKRLADSLARTKAITLTEIETIYHDTCTTAIDTYNEGFNLGYQVGHAEGSAAAPGRVDTFIITRTPTAYIETLKKEITRLQLAQQQAEHTAALRKADKNKWRTYFFVSAFVNLLLIALLFKKLYNDYR